MRSTIANSFGETLEMVLKTIPVQYNGRSTGPGRLTSPDPADLVRKPYTSRRR